MSIYIILCNSYMLASKIEKADLDGNGEVDITEFEKVYKNLVAESEVSGSRPLQLEPEPEFRGRRFQLRPGSLKFGA